jgi:TolB-like protein/DNA-binding response OmpR family regulator
MPASPGHATRRHRILIVAHDSSVRAHIARELKAADYTVELADGPAHARRIGLRGVDVAVVVPDGLGSTAHDFVSELEARAPTLLWPHTSALTRPEEIAALLAQIAAATRAPEEPEPGPSLRFAGYLLNFAAHSLTKSDGTDVPLTRGEFSLLREFVQRPERVLTRDQLMRTLVGRSAEVFDRSVDMLVSRLRRKIEPDFKRPSLIVTVPGAGYKFAGKIEVVTEAVIGQIDQSAGAIRDSRASFDDLGPVDQSAGKPSLAVLPFDNLAGDPDQEYFSDGLTDDLITELSRNTSLLVISRHSSFSFRGSTTDLRQIARDLRVRYIVEGSVRRAASRVRVNAKLIDAELGGHIWAERYDRAVKDVFAVQDEIVDAVTTAINPVVDDAEQRRAARKHPESLSAWEAYQRGRSHMLKFDVAENARARTFFLRAIELDPAFVPPYSALALTYQYDGSRFATRPLGEADDEATKWAQRAVDIDPADPDALAVLANATHRMGDLATARQWAARALASPQLSPWGMGMAAGVPLNDGRTAEAREILFAVIRRSPRDPFMSTFLRFIAMSYYYGGDFPNALEAAWRAVAFQPDNPMQYRWLAASLGQLGRTEEARNALRRAIDLSPETFDVYVRKRPPWFRSEDHELMLDGLRKAGWKS